MSGHMALSAADHFKVLAMFNLQLLLEYPQGVGRPIVPLEQVEKLVSGIVRHVSVPERVGTSELVVVVEIQGDGCRKKRQVFVGLVPAAKNYFFRENKNPHVKLCHFILYVFFN